MARNSDASMDKIKLMEHYNANSHTLAKDVSNMKDKMSSGSQLLPQSFAYVKSLDELSS